jgi:hypothetical protein
LNKNNKTPRSLIFFTALLRLVLIVIAIGIAITAGWFLFVFVAADSNQGETEAQRLAMICAVHIPASIVVGFLAYRFWYLSILVAWGCVAILGVVIIEVARGNAPLPSRPGEFVYLLILLTLTVLSVVFGWLGSHVRKFCEKMARS